MGNDYPCFIQVLAYMDGIIVKCSGCPYHGKCEQEEAQKDD